MDSNVFVDKKHQREITNLLEISKLRKISKNNSFHDVRQISINGVITKRTLSYVVVYTISSFN